MLRTALSSDIPGQVAVARDYALNGGVFHAETMSRQDLVAANLAALTTQVCTSGRVAIDAGENVRFFAFLTGTTAANTPTNWWLALYGPDGTLRCSTADQLTAAIAASTAFDVAVARDAAGAAIAGYVTPEAGLYTIAMMVKATATPTLQGVTLAAGASSPISGRQAIMALTHGSALTTTPPATIASPAAVATLPYLAAHA